MVIDRILAGSIGLGLTLLVSGCASYYTHYGAFSAANSAGESRQFKVTWQTAEYPGWWLSGDEATAITLVSQCSTREWKLDDSVQGSDNASEPSCGPGIVACGKAGKDILTTSGKRATSTDRCMEVTDAERISGLGRKINLSVYCRPAEKTVSVDGEPENRDYLRASVVPYEISVKKAERGSLYSRPPELGDQVCEAK